MFIKSRLMALACCCCIAWPAYAQSPAEFLKSMSGTWRGTGSIYASKEAKNTPLRCKITSVFDAQKRRLRNKGRCATAQRKTQVTGAIGYTEGSDKLNGSFINPLGNFEVTKSSGQINNNTLTLHTIIRDKDVNKIFRIRNVIKRISANKTIVTIYENEGGKYQQRGKITLTK